LHGLQKPHFLAQTPQESTTKESTPRSSVAFPAAGSKKAKAARSDSLMTGSVALTSGWASISCMPAAGISRVPAAVSLALSAPRKAEPGLSAAALPARTTAKHARTFAKIHWEAMVCWERKRCALELAAAIAGAGA